MTAVIDPTHEIAYVSGQGRPTWPALIADFDRRSAATAQRAGVRLDLAYGPHPRQTFDLVPATAPVCAMLVYLHPGYWQMRDKALFRFLGETFADLGCDVALANYPLAPDHDVAEITRAVRAIVPALRADARARHGRDLPIVAAGHSAGAHLAVELALTDPATWGLDATPIAAVLGLSGVYDLEPLVATTLNHKLALTPATARAASPVHRAAHAPCPALFAVGGGETPAFLAQTRAMDDAWRAGGQASREMIVDDADHFSLLDHLVEPTGALRAAIAELLDRTAPR